MFRMYWNAHSYFNKFLRDYFDKTTEVIIKNFSFHIFTHFTEF